MMCDPCFMDANQVGYVHELEWDEVQKILDDSLTIQPRRQMSVQFSGGEPTLSPHFLRAVQYARDDGLLLRAVRDQRHPLRAGAGASRSAAKDAGLRLAYLQFDGVTNEANSHRKVGNLFDVKLRAIENLHAAGIDVVLVVTVVNGVNDDAGRPDHRFRDRQRRQDHGRQLPAGELHRARRGHLRRDARSAALHALATSPTT